MCNIKKIYLVELFTKINQDFKTFKEDKDIKHTNWYFKKWHVIDLRNGDSNNKPKKIIFPDKPII